MTATLAATRPCRGTRHDHSDYSNGHCRCDTGRKAHRIYEGRRRIRVQERTFTAADFGIREFCGIRCAECRTPLTDSRGEPCWDILWPLRFVCIGGCRLHVRTAA